MEKIINKEKIKALYKEGKISKASYYRGLKRGYVILDYHKPHKKNKIDPQEFWGEFMKFYEKFKAIAKKAIATYEAWDIIEPHDLVSEGALYLLDRGIHPAHGWAEFKTYIRGIIRGKSKNTPYNIKKSSLPYTEVETNKDGDTYAKWLQLHLKVII